MRGAKTLALRMREHERNAQAVAEFSKRIRRGRVFYPACGRTHNTNWRSAK